MLALYRSGRRADALEAFRTIDRTPRRKLGIEPGDGLPGVGKTVPAVRIAHRLRDAFPDGQWYVRLAGAGRGRDPMDVLAELLRMSGLEPPDLPAHLDARAALMRARLADRRVLLLLDDVADAAALATAAPARAAERPRYRSVRVASAAACR